MTFIHYTFSFFPTDLELFEYLDQNKVKLNIQCYGASMDTMEDMYLRAGETQTMKALDTAVSTTQGKTMETPLDSHDSS